MNFCRWCTKEYVHIVRVNMLISQSIDQNVYLLTYYFPYNAGILSG